MEYKEFSTDGRDKSRRASNPDYRIQNAVFNQLQAGELESGNLMLTDNPEQAQILDAVCTLANLRKSGQIIKQSDADAVFEIISGSAGCLDFDFLERLEQIATASGLFILAYMIRREWEKLVLRQAEEKRISDRDSCVRLLWALTGRSRDDDAREMPGKVSLLKRPVLEPYIKSILPAFGLCESKPERSEFAGYIENKKIAIIGPSYSGIDHIEEIKSDFDIIIRMNYRGRDVLPEAQRELAADLSYYNGVMSKKITSPGEDVMFLKDLDFVVLKKCDKKVFKNITDYTHPREAKIFSGLFMLGAPNVLQSIFQDLLHYKPSRVKAFYVNLNLTNTLHDAAYLKALGRTALKPRDQWRSLAKHNFILQYDYTRLLFERGLIEADTRLSEVLTLGTQEYVRQLEEIERSK